MSGLDFFALGRAARECAEDAHGLDNMPLTSVAYGFVLDNPECFNGSIKNEDSDAEWPAGMPQNPPLAFINGYYGEVRSHSSDCGVWVREGCNCETAKDAK